MREMTFEMRTRAQRIIPLIEHQDDCASTRQSRGPQPCQRQRKWRKRNQEVVSLCHVHHRRLALSDCLRELQDPVVIESPGTGNRSIRLLPNPAQKERRQSLIRHLERSTVTALET